LTTTNLRPLARLRDDRVFLRFLFRNFDFRAVQRRLNCSEFRWVAPDVATGVFGRARLRHNLGAVRVLFGLRVVWPFSLSEKRWQLDCGQAPRISVTTRSSTSVKPASLSPWSRVRVFVRRVCPVRPYLPIGEHGDCYYAWEAFCRKPSAPVCREASNQRDQDGLYQEAAGYEQRYRFHGMRFGASTAEL
jgi:hypothetical protein